MVAPAVFVNAPAVMTFPCASAAMSLPASLLAPPTRRAQTKAPALDSFRMNASLLPALASVVVPAPGSKSAAPENEPVTRTFPLGSSAMPPAGAVPMPPSKLTLFPMPLAQENPPVLLYLAMKMPLEAVVDPMLVTPTPGSKSIGVVEA